MNNAEKIAIKIFQNGRNTTKGSAVSKHLIRKGVDSIEAHTNQTLQELKEKVESERFSIEDDSAKVGYNTAVDDFIHLIEKTIDEAINE